MRLRTHKGSLYLEEETPGQQDPALALDKWGELAVGLYALGNADGAPFAELPLQRQWEFHMTVHLALQIKHERLAALGSVLPLSAAERYQHAIAARLPCSDGRGVLQLAGAGALAGGAVRDAACAVKRGCASVG